MVTPILLSACATPSEIPSWFDSIQRLPIKTVQVQGHRIAYLDAGNGPPVILVHGFGGSLWQWEYQQTALSASHRVITLDLLGSGLSDKPDLDYTPTQMVEFFRSFMDALGIQRASLVGNSMGAGLVIGMALTYPDRVDRIVLISGLPDRVLDKLTGPLVRRAVTSRVPGWLVKFGNWLVGSSVTEAVLREIIYDESLITPAILDRSNRNRQRPGWTEPILTVQRNLPLWEEGLAKRLGEIRHPTLIIWGEEDRVFPMQVGRDLQKTISGSRLEVIPKAGHLPMWEQPETVNPLLLKFLQP
ncbi:MAG TPA: alpha/beta fold hydrolase [Nitrospiraceae bacterium]|nr:alpha/beta fold hydrolase [Nitrospiraceae bacterium]